MPDRSKRSLTLTIQGIQSSQPMQPFLRRQLCTACLLLNPPLTELSVVLVGDKLMSDLHQQFLSIPGPTDVLTFPLETDKKGRPLSGEVIICVPEARRRCRENSQNLKKELLLYALHGLLHLCGYDDRTDRDFRKMHAREDQILSQIGVGPVFFHPFKGGAKGGQHKPQSRKTRVKPNPTPPSRRPLKRRTMLHKTREKT